MKLIKFYSYMFFTLRKYYGDMWEAMISFIAIIAFNFMSLLFIIISITHDNSIKSVFLLETTGYFKNRIYILIVDLIPLFIIICTIYMINRKKINDYFEEFKTYSSKIKNRKKKWNIAYYVISVLFFIFSIISSSFF